MTGTPRILVEIIGNGLLGGLFDKSGRGKIGKTLTQVHGIVLNGQGRIFSKDRRSKAAHTLRRLKGRFMVDSLGYHASFLI